MNRLVSKSTGFSDFYRNFIAPPNAAFWNRRLLEHPIQLDPPHGLSAVDAKVMLDFGLSGFERSTGSGAILAVLGLTPILIKAALSDARVSRIYVIDQSAVEESYSDGRVRRIRGNWLDFAPAEPFDIVVGDEVLNNLSLQQHRSFFQHFAGVIQPGGTLAMRTLGLYDGAVAATTYTEADLLALAQSIGSHETSGVQNPVAEMTTRDINALILAFLMSPAVAYSEEKAQFDSALYNDLLRSWVGQGLVSATQVQKLWFPSPGAPSIRLTALEPSLVFGEAAPWFTQAPLLDVDAKYCDSGGLVRLFYKLTRFRRSQEPAGFARL